MGQAKNFLCKIIPKKACHGGKMGQVKTILSGIVPKKTCHGGKMGQVKTILSGIVPKMQTTEENAVLKFCYELSCSEYPPNSE